VQDVGFELVGLSRLRLQCEGERVALFLLAPALRGLGRTTRLFAPLPLFFRQPTLFCCLSLSLILASLLGDAFRFDRAQIPEREEDAVFLCHPPIASHAARQRQARGMARGRRLDIYDS
jgi:hypothetical protein